MRCPPWPSYPQRDIAQVKSCGVCHPNSSRSTVHDELYKASCDCAAHQQPFVVTQRLLTAYMYAAPAKANYDAVRELAHPVGNTR